MATLNPHPPDQFANMSQAAEYLGVHMSLIYDWKDDGTLPSGKYTPWTQLDVLKELIDYQNKNHINRTEASEKLQIKYGTFIVWENSGFIRRVDYDYRGDLYYDRQHIESLIGVKPARKPRRSICRTCKSTEKTIFGGYCVECYELSRERNVSKRYLTGMSLQAIGDEDGISRERIRQLLKRAESIESAIIGIESRGSLHAHIKRTKSARVTEQRAWYKYLTINRDQVLLDAQNYHHLGNFMRAYDIPSSQSSAFKQNFPEIYTAIKPKWSTEHDQCKLCNGTDHKHKRWGYCEKCYTKAPEWAETQNKYRQKHIAEIRARNKIYGAGYAKRPEVKERVKLSMYNKHFDGNRETALSLHGFKCADCGISREAYRLKYNKDIPVYRADGDMTNNTLNNLVPLCLSCLARRKQS